MKEPKKNENIKPGLEEAIHPEIGNGSSWAEDDHNFSLRSVDPLKSLDHRLLQDETKRKVIQTWQTEYNGEPPADSASVIETKTVEDEKELSTKSPPLQTEVAKIPEKEEFKASPLKAESISTSPPKESGSATKKERKKKEKAPMKPGKRVRKLAEKVQQEEEARNKERARKSAPAQEMSLSPFTNWLKGLSGSEYVHPYEDDFAFGHGREGVGGGISETFADLLAAQGYKDQAIAMYTRLMEKFPEKSLFFAAKIEALQQ